MIDAIVMAIRSLADTTQAASKNDFGAAFWIGIVGVLLAFFLIALGGLSALHDHANQVAKDKGKINEEKVKRYGELFAIIFVFGMVIYLAIGFWDVYTR